jgi:secondary thiamine-phosphate synthase enzyme
MLPSHDANCTPAARPNTRRFIRTTVQALRWQDVRMRSELITVRTGNQPKVHDLTSRCERFVTDAGDGLLSIFVPHATAGVAILETGAGSDLDLLHAIDDLLPRDARWQHRHGSAGHGRDHVVPALIAPSMTVPVLGGRLQLGVWQSICLVDTNIDNAEREVRLSFLSG